MAGIVVIRSNFASTTWKSVFAERLIALCPDINPDAADEAADSAVLECRNTEPAAAARRWAQSHSACAPNAGPADQAAAVKNRSRAG